MVQKAQNSKTDHEPANLTYDFIKDTYFPTLLALQSNYTRGVQPTSYFCPLCEMAAKLAERPFQLT